jgi:hypothetical protein
MIPTNCPCWRNWLPSAMLVRSLHQIASWPIDVELLGDLLYGLDALDRFKRDAGFEFWFVYSSFGFHFVWFRLRPATGHHNHSFAPGPISRFCLTLSLCNGQRSAVIDLRSDLKKLSKNITKWIDPRGWGRIASARRHDAGRPRDKPSIAV